MSEVRISGDFRLASVLAGGLPTSEELEHVADLQALRSPPLALHRPLRLFIGVVSTANNFKRRMAVRRSWMQFDAVKSGAVAVRFFVGLVRLPPPLLALPFSTGCSVIAQFLLLPGSPLFLQGRPFLTVLGQNRNSARPLPRRLLAFLIGEKAAIFFLRSILG